MFHSYDLNGSKDSFSEVISNISPEDTILVSQSKKTATPATLFKWQTDALDPVIYDLATTHEVIEGADVPATEVIGVKGTKEVSNNTQIFRKTFSISDSALSSSVHGRKGELELQLKKAGKELKIVIEKAFSSAQKAVKSASGVAPITNGLFAQIADLDVDNPDMPTPATAGDFAVHKKGAIDFDTLDSVCLALYRNGSKANVILVNPVNYEKVIAASLPASGAATTRSVFSAGGQDITYQIEVEKGITKTEVVPTFRDTFGGIWEIRKSRYMPVDLVYFLNTEDITQHVLREPVASKLGKNGSFETWQLVIETGLALSNPYAAGVLEVA